MRNHLVMLAAALTLWWLFALWIATPVLGLPRLVQRTAGLLLCAELVALFLFSYGTEGCDEPTCPPVARAAGVAARTDLPALALAFLAVVVYGLARGRLRTDQPPANTTS